MKKTAQKKEAARQWLQDEALTRGGAMKIATYFIATVSWSRLVQAYIDLKD